MKRRVVVTGIGLVSPLGGRDSLWSRLLAGESGIRRITRFDVSDFPVQAGAEVTNFDPLSYLDRKQARHMDRFCQYAVCSALEALQDAQLVIDEQIAERTGVIVGSGTGGIETLEKQADILRTRGIGRVNPFFVPMFIPNMAAGQVGIHTGAKGSNTCVVTACASGTHSIGEAFRAIVNDQADVMLAGGAEAGITPLSLAGFIAARALSTRSDNLQGASRPFDAQRDGFVMGEGAGILVLEEASRAEARGAKIYGEVVGFGATSDAYHVTTPAPEGEGAQRAMVQALTEAGMTADQIDYINAHGTSTEYNDKTETVAIKRVFGDYAKRVPISSTKSLVGHLLGASGALEAAVCLLGIVDQQVPGTHNYEHFDPDCDLDYIPNSSRQLNIEAVMSNSFGFGGHNGVLVFRRWNS